jgi:hypothetical protein
MRPGRLNRDLEDELQFHIERRTDELIAQGVPPGEARREALHRFGNRTLMQERARDLDIFVWLETALQDIRYALRTLRRNPGFAATAILSLALAIGANTAIYSIVDAAMLRPLPVPEPDGLFTLATPEWRSRSDLPGESESFSYPLYQRFQAAAGTSARLALFSSAGGGPIEVQIPDAAAPSEKAVRYFASGDAFEILRVPPALGRVFSAEEDRGVGRHPVVVISYDYWQRRFHGDPAVVGQRLFIWGKTYSVMGAARQGFFGVEPGKFVDIWLPATMYSPASFTSTGWAWFRIVRKTGPRPVRTGLLLIGVESPALTDRAGLLRYSDKPGDHHA